MRLKGASAEQRSHEGMIGQECEIVKVDAFEGLIYSYGMTTIAFDRRNGSRTFWALFLITAFLFAMLGGMAYLASTRQVSQVPLKPCRQCTMGCPCPRLSGAVRCGCPD